MASAGNSLTRPSEPEAHRDFTLVSCDGKSFKVDAALLIGHSKVFADMLSTTAHSDDGKENTCTVSEDSVAVAVWLDGIRKKAAPETGQAWRTLFEMSDKYDCDCLRLVLVDAAWSKLQTDPVFSYAAGFHLANRRLMERSAQAALEVDLAARIADREAIWLSLPEVDRLRLERFHLAHLRAASCCLGEAVQSPSCRSHNNVFPRTTCAGPEELWQQVLLSALRAVMTHQGYDLRKLVTKPLSPTCARGETTTPEKIWPTCYVCASWMVDQINALAASWEREVAKISLF